MLMVHSGPPLDETTEEDEDRSGTNEKYWTEFGRASSMEEDQRGQSEESSGEGERQEDQWQMSLRIHGVLMASICMALT
jgi:hypothetical protein